MEEIRQAVQGVLGSNFTLDKPATGGIVNAGQAFICNTDTGKVFIKYNTTEHVTIPVLYGVPS